MPLLDDVAAFITANVINVVPEASGYVVKKSYKPDSPDKIITVYETLGRMPETTMDVDYPAFQVQVRAEPRGYAAGRVVAEALYRALQTTSLADEDVSPASTYVYCYAVNSGVLPLGNDVRERPEFSMNFRTMRSVT